MENIEAKNLPNGRIHHLSFKSFKCHNLVGLLKKTWPLKNKKCSKNKKR